MFSTEMESSRGPQSPRTLRASAAPPNISTYSLSVRVSQKQLINEIETCWKGREGGRTKRHQAFERPLEPKEARKHTLMHDQRGLRHAPYVKGEGGKGVAGSGTLTFNPPIKARERPYLCQI